MAWSSLLWTGISVCLAVQGMAQINRRPAATGQAAEKPLGAISWQDIQGKTYDLSLVRQNKATVFFFSSTQCPIANIYTPRMVEIGKEFQSRGVQFFLVNSNREDTLPVLKQYAARRGFPYPVVKDNGTQLADHLAAHRTPEAIILDSNAVVRYRGAIDDNQKRERVARDYVRNALKAILADKPVPITRSLAFGCDIFRDHVEPKTTAAKYTYARDVAPILYQNCLSCHRTGEAAPFPLETYQQAKTWASAIKVYTARRAMPPWKAVEGYGDFHDARRLTEAQIATLAKWADSGAPAGDLSKAPKLPPPPKEGWTLGTPDMVLSANAPYTLGAEGNDDYRHFVLPVATDKDFYLRGIEFRPDNRAIVHHIIVFFDLSGKSVELDKADPAPGYSVNDGTGGIGVPFDQSIWVAGWAPGNTPNLLPEGMAFKLPRGAKVVMQVHYHRNGQVEKDQTKIGFYLTEENKVDKVVMTDMVINPWLDIKPGLANQKVTARHTLRQDTEIIAVMPHMHMLGREMKIKAVLPDNSQVPMIYINDWDFNWQETYRYKKFLRLPKGTRLELTALYDNTEQNPRQPSHPPKRVTWGEQTTDEMCIGFFQYTVKRTRETARSTP
jgi:peroxiredoxin